MHECSKFSILLQSPIIVFNCRHVSRCDVVSHCDFDLHFLITTEFENIFVSLLPIHIFSLEKYLFVSLAHLLIRLFFLYY